MQTRDRSDKSDDSEFLLNSNELVRFLKKDPTEFMKEDIIRFCMDNRVQMVNFRYAAEDGKLKTFHFVVSSKKHLDTILSNGERVDGSNLFSFIEAGGSDLYVIPRYRTAFMNPFTEAPTLELLCSFYNCDGKPLESSPQHVLRKANQEFTRRTGYTFKALGELEFYVLSPRIALYPGRDQRGYHSAEPFVKFGALRDNAMRLIARAGGRIKYGHSEVGCFSDDERYYEQHEIEFLPMPVEQAAEHLIIAKWVLRMLGYQYGVEISFAPKITIGKAGNGMHFHILVEMEGRNMLVEGDSLSPLARKMIAGILDSADALTAFGNTIPTSYLRLVPHQEAPTTICWGDRNRSVVVRVPLGWIGADGMINDANPCEILCREAGRSKQTLEYRVADGSADPYLTIAALIVASLHGIEMPGALEAAERLYVSGNVYRSELKECIATFKQLPASCVESAEALETKRALFEANNIFPSGMIDNRISSLRSFNDRALSERLYGNIEAIRELLRQYTDIA